MFFAFCVRNTDDDRAAANHLDNEARLDLDHDEEYLQSIDATSPFARQLQSRPHRLEDHEVAQARAARLREVQMWNIIRELLTFFCYLAMLYTITYMNVDQNAFQQVNHLRKFFLNPRSVDTAFDKVRAHFSRADGRSLGLLT